MFGKLKHEWNEMEPKYRVVITALVVAGSIGIFIVHQKNTEADARKRNAVAGTAVNQQGDAPAVPGAKPYNWAALPTTNRNQGLEDVMNELRSLREELNQYKANAASGTIATKGGRTASASQEGASSNAAQVLNSPISAPSKEDLVPPIKFEATRTENPGQNPGRKAEPPLTKAAPEATAGPSPKVWQPVSTETKEIEASPKLVIPVNTGLEAVLLSGVAARPSGATGGAVGSALSANSVGAPFVTRLKGSAILPNGWKVQDLGDCFLGGSAVAVLSAERAYAISDTLSCVAANGEVYEGSVKAYGLDVDGTLGLAGKVVSKQGAILFQALLTGLASGLGAALTPTPIAGANTSSNGSAQGVQYADTDTIARTAVGTGVGNATSQLSRFYLEFAKETFPVIEVVAGTRITWILKETIELKRTRKAAQ